ncbi:hypothetical protein M407DRAFT_32437 [Tulasnella calospora MUT 4182]|uniref:Uncharacterized protein n=1 Tax=Tulasnella calospora MUT 4182 TaxID=1051891 RepID=A0A0C3K932_9AGAM|nr:hypothetical protein M407DRAFT_32437 [Tulasnella calospora MUT 4182]
MPIQPAPPAPPPAADDDDDDDSEDERLSDPNLCEECHRKPKLYDSSKGIQYQFCGRRCRDVHAVRDAQPHCKLKGCKKTFNTNDEYCSQEHAQEAIRRGEAQACPVCHTNPIANGFKHCSRECAIKQANQPKPNGLARSGSSGVFQGSFTPPASTRHGSLPPPPAPANAVNKDADAPTTSGPGPCEHCGAQPKSVKVHRHCSKECARAARAGKKGPRGYADSDEDSWPEDAPPSKKPQPRAYDDDDDDGWGSVQSPLPQQHQVNPGNSKAYSCCGCTITVPSGSPPAECPICKLDEVKKELEAEKAKPPVVIRIPQSPPAPAPAPVPAPPQPAPVPVPAPPAPAPVPAPAPAPTTKPVQATPRVRPSGPVQQPRKVTPSPAPKPAPPQPEPPKQTAKPPVQPTRRQLDEDDDDDDDDDDMDFFVRQPDPPPAPASKPVTVESDDDDDEDFFVR